MVRRGGRGARPGAHRCGGRAGGGVRNTSAAPPFAIGRGSVVCEEALGWLGAHAHALGTHALPCDVCWRAATSGRCGPWPRRCAGAPAPLGGELAVRGSSLVTSHAASAPSSATPSAAGSMWPLHCGRRAAAGAGGAPLPTAAGRRAACCLRTLAGGASCHVPVLGSVGVACAVLAPTKGGVHACNRCQGWVHQERSTPTVEAAPWCEECASIALCARRGKRLITIGIIEEEGNAQCGSSHHSEMADLEQQKKQVVPYLQVNIATLRCRTRMAPAPSATARRPRRAAPPDATCGAPLMHAPRPRPRPHAHAARGGGAGGGPEGRLLLQTMGG